MESSSATGSIPVVLNTTVLDHFYHRDPNINTSFPVKTTAACGAGGVAAVSRASDFAESDAAVTGAIQHAIVGEETGVCSVEGETSASLSFALTGSVPVSIVTVVRTSRDPGCVVQPTTRKANLCRISADAATAATEILHSLNDVTVSEAKADHTTAWQEFWNQSTISLPSAPETERFWYGSQYILNSAIPKEGQEPTPPGLYGPWGSTDNPGWHGDFTIDYNVSLVALVVILRSLSDGVVANCSTKQSFMA